MSFLKKLFLKKEAKETPIQSYADFWNWFQIHEKDFFDVVKNGDYIEKGFFDKLGPKLDELKEGYYYLTGMENDDTAELIITAEGNLKNIVFVEELIATAPNLKNWKFTPLKPPLDIKDVNIAMAGYEFCGDNIYFYANELLEYPDEIDITIIHNDYNQDNRDQIVNGVYIFLDNYLGELNFITGIDEIRFIEKYKAEKELVPISKLKDFLIWREKEFLEKYQGIRNDNGAGNYSLMEAKLQSGNMLLAVINTDLLDWDSKGSHPWIAVLIVHFDAGNNGMPDDDTMALLEEIEDSVLANLKDFDGYINIGRQTADGTREIYFACKDFRKPSRIFFDIQKAYTDRIKIEYDIYKDKYWQSFERFNTGY
ncbi:DUF695 domain-containing protein [Emticicia agri]|uniref:DUF695 domain-containing protein n=1 Tax=Emticicia agri TaxID=2492393 RepID=A0A4Q5M5A4_9BACT|nr:DUF695 domain-containing protein [Emticicia agri]RYU97542.1 DUF695 domain-containing protein [Emticicia agri]